jgi:hypothetical protein
LITVLILALNLTSSSYPCLIPFHHLLAFADEDRTWVAELKEFQFTYTACYAAVTHPFTCSKLAKNNTKHICKTEATNTAHVHNITHILHLLIAPRFHQPKEATTILRKTTIVLGPYRLPAET